jgi:hypothetical protein
MTTLTNLTNIPTETIETPKTIIHQSMRELRCAVDSVSLDAGDFTKTTTLITSPFFRVQIFVAGVKTTHLVVLEGRALLQWAKNYIA